MESGRGVAPPSPVDSTFSGSTRIGATTQIRSLVEARRALRWRLHGWIHLEVPEQYLLYSYLMKTCDKHSPWRSGAVRLTYQVPRVTSAAN